MCDFVDGGQCVCGETVQPPEPQCSSTMLLVEDNKAKHLEKRRKLELKLLEKQIETEEKRKEAFAAIQILS